MREDGFYWVRLKAEGPDAKAEVMRWETYGWWRYGMSAVYHDEFVEVLAGPLRAPVGAEENSAVTAAISQHEALMRDYEAGLMFLNYSR